MAGHEENSDLTNLRRNITYNITLNNAQINDGGVVGANNYIRHGDSQSTETGTSNSENEPIL